MTDNEAFADCRLRLGMTIRAFAALVGVSNMGVWCVEAGRNGPRPATLALARHLAGSARVRKAMQDADPARLTFGPEEVGQACRALGVTQRGLARLALLGEKHMSQVANGHAKPLAGPPARLLYLYLAGILKVPAEKGG